MVRTGRGAVAALLVVALAAALLSVTPLRGTAAAVQPGSHAGAVVSPTPASWTPHVLDGYVAAVAEVGSTVVVGGNFTSVREAGGTTAVPRAHLFAFTKGTGAITPLDLGLNGEVQALLPTGDGRTVWVAGGFSSLGGRTVRSLAKVDVLTGERVAQFAPPALDGRVHDVALRGDRLYVTGRFLNVGGSPHTLLAAVDPVTGALDPAVRLDFADPRNGGVLSILSADVTPDGTRLVATGNFTRIGGLPRYQIGIIDLTTTPVSVLDWSTDLYGNGCGTSFQSYMRDVDIAPDGSHFVVVTTGGYSSTLLCDTAARWDLDRRGTGQRPSWVDHSGGDTLTEVAVTDSAVYVGGHPQWMNNPYSGRNASAGAVERPGIAALDRRSGVPLSWNPGRDRGVGVYGFLATDDGLWVGSDTERFAGFLRPRLAYVPLAGGSRLPPESIGSLPGRVVSLGLTQGGAGADLDRTTSRQLAAGGAVTAASTSAGTTQWRNLRGAFMVEDLLYTVWADATLRVQTFDGATFGPQQVVPLALVPGVAASLNRFATEDAANLTGMFYDPVRARIYFTRVGSSQLFWRGFSPESQIVEAARGASVANAGGVAWIGVRSMFLADGRLYTGDANGNLTSRAWDAASGLPVGPSTLVSGPGVDGQDWRARDAVVVAGTTPPPNSPPVAAFTASCAGLTCSFDGSGSSDADGSVQSWSWAFGDGATGSGSAAGHTYAGAGPRTVTLTVTDDRGATASTTRSVVASDPGASTVAFRATASSNVNSTVHRVAVPAAVQPGDRMVVVATVNSADVALTPPAGWDELRSVVDATAGLRSVAWTRVAAAGDAGAPVELRTSAFAKASVQLLAYAGAGPVTASEVAVDTVLRAERTTPTVTVGTAGSALVSVWADKSSGTTGWVVPPAVTVRDTSLGSGSGRITSVAADAVLSSTGPAGGLTATASEATRRAVAWSLVIAPAGTPPPPPPPPPPPASSVSYRGVASSNANTSAASVVVPSNVLSGDVLVLLATLNTSSVTLTDPPGWTPVDGTADPGTGTTTRLWVRTATAADAGARVTVPASGLAKTALHLAAYTGAAGVTAAHAVDPVERTARTTPVLDAPAGAAVVQYWADKSSDNTGWLLPAEVTGRDVSVGTGSGRIVAALADEATAVAGPAGGRTALSVSSNRRAIVWTVVLAPAP